MSTKPIYKITLAEMDDSGKFVERTFFVTKKEYDEHIAMIIMEHQARQLEMDFEDWAE